VAAIAGGPSLSLSTHTGGRMYPSGGRGGMDTEGGTPAHRAALRVRPFVYPPDAYHTRHCTAIAVSLTPLLSSE